MEEKVNLLNQPDNKPSDKEGTSKQEEAGIMHSTDLQKRPTY